MQRRSETVAIRAGGTRKHEQSKPCPDARLIPRVGGGEGEALESLIVGGEHLSDVRDTTEKGRRGRPLCRAKPKTCELVFELFLRGLSLQRIFALAAASLMDFEISTAPASGAARDKSGGEVDKMCVARERFPP